MKPLGLGRFVLDSLYDVRDELGELIGYSRANPAASRQRMIELHFIEGDHRPYFVGDNHSIDRQSMRTIRIEVGEYSLDGRLYACWKVPLAQAVDLLMTPFIECTGADCLNDWISELRLRRYRNDSRYHWLVNSGRRK